MFDMGTRERVRLALLGYMQQHQIGVPRLSILISKANTREPDVSIKTLQRFLAGHMRTNDGFVALCAKFAEKLPVADPVGDLGKVLAMTYASERSRVEGEFSTTQSRVDGEYMAERGFLTSTAAEGYSRVVMRLETVHAIYDGAMILTGGYNFAAMRDRLSRQPMTLCLRFNTFARFSGTGMTSTFPFSVSIESLEQ